MCHITLCQVWLYSLQADVIGLVFFQKFINYMCLANIQQVWRKSDVARPVVHLRILALHRFVFETLLKLIYHNIITNVQAVFLIHIYIVLGIENTPLK